MIIRNQPLTGLNTFHINAISRCFVEIRTVEKLRSLRQLPDYADLNWFVLGGGSNILLTQDLHQPTLKVSIPGITVFPENTDDYLVKVGAGVVWNDLVLWSMEEQLYGLENLSLIPGQVGAAPIQNIGAYGVELTQVFHSLEAYSISDDKFITFNHSDCDFGYRSSVFKKELKSKYIITSVTLRLSKSPRLMLDYGDIRAVLSEMNVEKVSPADVSRAVVSIRKSKLPDPEVIGNAGSFFKNPEISESKFNELKNRFALLPGYPMSDGRVKVPAGWLIDQLGWKGKRRGDAGVHERQALVLVNHGNASGAEILQLAEEIQASVKDAYGIHLEPEVNII